MSNMSVNGEISQPQQHQDTITNLERRIAALQAAEFQPLQPLRVPTQSRTGVPLYRVDERNGDSHSTVSADSPYESSSVPVSATTFTHPFAARRASAAQHTPASSSCRAPSSGNDADGISGGRTLFERYNETVQTPRKSLIGNGLRNEDHKMKGVDDYAEPFINFMTENPTIWHAISYWENKLEKAGYKRVGFLTIALSS
jgi:hypothetical protein